MRPDELIFPLMTHAGRGGWGEGAAQVLVVVNPTGGASRAHSWARPRAWGGVPLVWSRRVRALLADRMCRQGWWPTVTGCPNREIGWEPLDPPFKT